ncbi:hypothetical protein GCM10009557_62570 [Virgisporangium ochraceum]
MTRTTAVYGTRRRGPHALVLVALAVLLVGVLTGIALAFQAMNDAEPVGSARAAAIAPPSAAPVSRRPVPSSAPPSSAPPSSAPPQPQQVGAVRNQATNLCLDLQPDQPGAGGLLLMLPCAAGAPNQRWQRTPTGMMVNGATGLCLTVAGAAAEDRARVQQEPCGDAPHQHWTMFMDADGTVTFGAQHSSRCLDVQDNNPAPGTPVQQYVCNGTSAQRWVLQPA